MVLCVNTLTFQGESIKSKKSLLVGSLILVAGSAHAEVCKGNSADVAKTDCIKKMLKTTIHQAFENAPITVQSIQDGGNKFVVNLMMNNAPYTAQMAAQCSNKNYLKNNVYSYSEATCNYRNTQTSDPDFSHQLSLKNKKGEVVYNFGQLTEYDSGGC